MKIFVFGTRGFPHIQGGVEKHCESLYSMLTDQFDITVFRRKPYLDQTGNNNSAITFIDLPSTRIKGFEAFFHSFLCALYCIVKRPDMIHIHNIGPGMFIPLLKLFGLKIVLTYHSPNYEHDKWGFFSKNILRLSESLSTVFADRIIFVNQTRKEMFGQRIQNKSVVIPNGVSVVRKSDNIRYLTSLGLVSGKYILSVGRITQEKGFDYLIDAFIESHLIDYKLVIVGGSDHKTGYSDHLDSKIRNYPDIIMTGYLEGENLRQIYSHAALFVLPSYNEGFPLVLLEAMSYQLPILASDISANRLVNLDETAYFEVGNVTDLTRHIKMVLSTGRKTILYDLSSYSWENVARQTASVYRSIPK